MLFSGSYVVSLLAVTGVNAGSRTWQPPLHHAKSAIAARELSVGIEDVGFNGTRGSSPHSAHQKRFFGITNPATTGPYPQLWPGGNINACFQQVQHTVGGVQKSTRDILYDNLITARELWRSAGLDDKKGNFQFNILPDNDPGCQRSQRSTHLLLIYAGEGVRKMSTTVGVERPNGSPDDPNVPEKDLGPSMTLTDILDIGMENVVANYAHEMGHAWGLHHEHQNPKWWDERFSGVERENFFFSEDNFHCENLADFDTAMAPFANLPEWDRRGHRNDICRKRAMAGGSKFAGGWNYIPITDEPSTIDDGKNEPDWQSIMLYPSNAGGKTVNGVKQNVLTKMNGDVIQPNSRPSQRDVSGLKRMYGVKSSLVGKLLGDRSNPFKNIFDKVRRNDQDSSCM